MSKEKRGWTGKYTRDPEEHEVGGEVVTEKPSQRLGMAKSPMINGVYVVEDQVVTITNSKGYRQGYVRALADECAIVKCTNDFGGTSIGVHYFEKEYRLGTDEVHPMTKNGKPVLVPRNIFGFVKFNWWRRLKV